MAATKHYDLPVKVSSEDLDSNPKLAQLLNIVSHKLSPDGTSAHLNRELEQTEMDLSHARYNWLMSHVPYYELHELLMDYEIKGVERMLSADEEQFKDVLSQALAASELEDYLSVNSNPTSVSSLFNLTQADIDRHNPVKHLLPAVQQAVLPMLEDRLRKKCEELYDFFSTNAESGSVSDKLLLAKAETLPHLVEEKQQQLSRDKIVLRETKLKKNDHFLLYYQTLLECLSLMESLIKDYKFKCQSETDFFQVKLLEAQSGTVVRKARMMQLQVLCDTYTVDNVKALRDIERHLDKAIRQTEMELASTHQALMAYHAMGAGFKLLGEEYSKIKSEIDSYEWGLQHFQQTDRRETDYGQQETDKMMETETSSGIMLQGVGGGPSDGGAIDDDLDLSLAGAFGGLGAGGPGIRPKYSQ